MQREISDISVRRSFAALALSLVVIAISVWLLVIFEPKTHLTHIVFEVVSAFSTVGLSMGITSGLSDFGKMVIIITMFVGRVSMLTLLSAILRKIGYIKYQYPSEHLLIN